MENPEDRTVDQAIRALRRHNFTEIIKIDEEKANIGAEEYSYSAFIDGGKKHVLKRLCHRCEDAGCSSGIGDAAGYKLRNVSHGAHSIDFFQAIGEDYFRCTSGWHDEPVMFVYENPANDGDFIVDKDFGKAVKDDWYWVQLPNPDPKGFHFPHHFGPKKYGEFVLSAMNLFRLRNVYMTNLVKCGLSDSSGSKFVNLGKYQPETIEKCYWNHLAREIEIFCPKVIFVIGSNAQWQFRRFYKGNAIVQDLPHPASRSLKAEYFQTLYFWLIHSALKEAAIVSDLSELCRLMDLFFERRNET